jgi:DNA repair protein SbcD/Mre11
LKVFHTADWHLGQTFFGFDRDFEHTRFLDWLIVELEAHQPDAMIIAGDIFDTINPSAVAQRRFYNFLANAHAALPHLKIVITAGNHDAAARLEAPADLLDSLNISVVGTVKRDDDGEIDYSKFLVPLKSRSGCVEAIVVAVPFLRPSDVPMAGDSNDPYLDGIRELYRQATLLAKTTRSESYPDAALLAIGHCHLNGGDESRDSERRLVIGGAEAVQIDVFEEELAYVALGHLHKAQQFQGGRVRYSGSPIPLSFAEATYRHRLHCLTFDNGKLVSVDDHAIPRVTRLLRVPEGGAAKLDDLLEQLTSLPLDDALPVEQQPFLEVRVLEDGPDPTRRKKIEDALNGRPVRLASIKLETKISDSEGCEGGSEVTFTDLKSINCEDIFLEHYRSKYKDEPDSDLLAAFREIVSSVQQEVIKS